MGKMEMVEVKLKLPKALVDFIQAMGEDVEEYLAYTIIDGVHAAVEAGEFTQKLIDKQGLPPLFKAYGVISDC